MTFTTKTMASGALAVLLGLAFAPAAGASLIGDTIEFQISGSVSRDYDAGGFFAIEEGTITYFENVVATDGLGPEVVYEIFGEDTQELLATMSFDIFAEDIFVYFDVETELSSGFSFVDFYSIDWVDMPDGELLNVQVINHDLPVSGSLFSVASHSFLSDWTTDGVVGPGSYTVQYHLITDHEIPQNPVIPEPMTLSLFGIGLAGLAWRKRATRS